ncbi:MAG: hypothetical protein GY903_04080 [Fuerstiella sp.]|nr:hypothetical protein [Fuerstiella sp.]
MYNASIALAVDVPGQVLLPVRCPAKQQAARCTAAIRRLIAIGLTLVITVDFVPQTLAQDSQSALPFAGTDVITVLDGSTETTRHVSGRIEDITGEALTLRRGGRGTLEVFRVTDIVELRFSRSADFEEGLNRLQQGQTRRALEYLDRALKSESRPWAWNELQAIAAKAAVRAGERVEAVNRIDLIFAEDRRTRHVSSLPLVWDARLPPQERLPENPAGLDSDSLVQQLAAASAVLHNVAHRGRASAVLERLRRRSGLRRISELAETQLWRLHLLEQPDTPSPVLNVWSDRVQHLPVAARSGPQYVVGRCLLQKYDHDRASLAFLWMPLMTPDDHALAARSLAEGIQCLKVSGRQGEAARLTTELERRFHGTSAARNAVGEVDDPE